MTSTRTQHEKCLTDALIQKGYQIVPNARLRDDVSEYFGNGFILKGTEYHTLRSRIENDITNAFEKAIAKNNLLSHIMIDCTLNLNDGNYYVRCIVCKI